jgi:excinuclease ABC subunit A
MVGSMRKANDDARSPLLAPAHAVGVRGARAHNLRDLDVDLPLGRWIALTGPSGSGKTSLAFDVVHREGQRRYLGSLSAKARHRFTKLGRAEAEAVLGLPVTLAIGQGSTTPHARSTVGTLVGVLDLLRLWFARSGHHSQEATLTRSHFSFNRAVGACPACAGLGEEDEVDPALLVADASRSIREGALVPTLANGYTVYSQVTLEVMNEICQAHGFDVDTPWIELTDAQRQVIFFGTKKLVVPFGKHSIESRMRWAGITARPREEGHYRGLIPVIEETLARDRNPNVLRFVRSVPCRACQGTRLGPVGRETAVGGMTLPELLQLPVEELPARLDALPQDAVLAALRPTLDPRLRRMDQLSLGHLRLDRRSASLSGGEAQRLRLAAQLAQGLGRMLVILDEPTLGLHPSSHAGMAEVLSEILALGNSLLVVDHDPRMVQLADHWLALGPGAGPHGGRVVRNEAMPLAALTEPMVTPPEVQPRGTIRLTGARLHNLDGVALDIPLGAMTVLTGPSGAGKSSLLFQTLRPALQREEGGPYASLQGVPEGLTVRAVDAEPIGRTSRSTPATYTGLFDAVRKRFAKTAEAKRRGWKASRFSYNTKAGRCPTCEGLGRQRIGMHLLEDVERACDACEGRRYADELRAVELRGLSIDRVLELTAEEAMNFFADDPPCAAVCQALDALGLGYLQLGQPSNTLSRGEAQRIKLATLLGKPAKGESVVLLDEPDRGLHPDDVARLLRCLHGLLEAGHTVVVISHHPMVWRASHHRVALREGARVDPLPAETQPAPPQPAHPVTAPPASLTLVGVRTHNLTGFDVAFRHEQITAVTGPSGSGKSSLVFDTLAAAAWSRFAESLPFEVRRYLRHQPRPTLEEATGLSPVVALRQGQGRAGARSTVGTLTDLDADLRLLWSRLGELDGAHPGWSASHFSANQVVGACPTCTGLGVVQRCDPDRLITHPDRDVADGAMAGTKPGAYFGEADGQFIATLRTAAKGAGVSVTGPFASLSRQARRLALEGTGETSYEVSWEYKRGKRAGVHEFSGPWLGLCALVEREAQLRAGRKNAAEWSAPLAPQPCPECHGERLAPEARRVTVDGLRLPELSRRSLSEVGACLRAMELPAADRPVFAALRARLDEGLAGLCALGLGHLGLDRLSRTLSSGERQRLRLAAVLGSELRGVTLALDEPGQGLADAALVDLSARLRAFRDAGNTVVLVTHRRALIEAADEVIALGPGAGQDGGQLVYQGPPRPREAPSIPTSDLTADGTIQVRGARAHNLRDLDVELPDQGLVAITGPSGSGKTTFLFDVLGASVAAGAPRGCEAIEGMPTFARTHLTREVTAASPLSALSLMPALQTLFHDLGSELPKRAFSFRSPAGRCPACKGTGHERIAMDFMADLRLPCETCHGRRYHPEVLAVRWNGLTIADVLESPVAHLAPLFAGELRVAVDALCRLGLGHLGLGRAEHLLSGGERQRLLLAAALAQRGAGRELFLLDEPASGLHVDDQRRLAETLHELAANGALVVYTTHRHAMIDTAHLSIELGPGGGPDGGRLVNRVARG